MDNDLQSFITSLSALQESLRKINADIETSFAPLVSSFAELQKQYMYSFEPLRLSSKQLSVSILNSIYGESFHQQLQQLQDSFSSLSDMLKEISVHENYVSVPKSLIPDDFEYEEVPVDQTQINESYCEKSYNSKRLSRSDALSLISLIITALLFFLSPFYDHLISDYLSENKNANADSPMTTEQANQIIEYLSELTSYQEDIRNIIESSEGSIQESDLHFDDTQPHLATPDSSTAEHDKFSPTSGNESDSSEQLPKAEQK